MLDTITPPAPAPPTEIPHLTEAYQKAHKNYALVSGILIAWELVGIELTPEPFESVNVKLLSPEAAPFVLISLVVYFAFRLTVEWLQCDVRRRRLLPSRIDFGSSHFLAGAAISIYGVQRLLEVQIYEYLNAPGTGTAVIGGLLIGVSGATVIALRRQGRERPRLVYEVIIGIGVAVIAWAFYGRQENDILIAALAGVVWGAFAGYLQAWFYLSRIRGLRAN